MKKQPTAIQFSEAEVAFGKQSFVFDDIYGKNITIQYKRKRVRDCFEKHLPAQANILELNAGTGEDTLYFAEKGYLIHATDVSADMLFHLQQKAATLKEADNITTEKISFTELNNLKHQKQYDAIFSNFGGLNCAEDLSVVLQSFNSLLKPDGIVTMVIMPRFCLWEFLLILKGDFKTALRRFKGGKSGATAHIDGVYFKCWYYSPFYIIKYLKNNFELLGVEGLCTIVPPSYHESFPVKFPKLFRVLCKTEDILKSIFPFNLIGDYYIISLKRK